VDLRLGFVTDVHFGPDTRHEGKLRKLCHAAPALLDDAVRRLDEILVGPDDLLVNLGDDVEDVWRDQDLAQYTAVQAALRRARCEVVNVAGNHDQVYLTEDDLRRAWCRDGPLYYSLDRGGLHLVVLRTIERSGVDISVEPEQLAWLRADLAAGQGPAVVLMHHSAAEQDTSDSRWFAGAPHIALVRERAELRRIFEQSGRVRAVFNGHLHWNHLDVIRGIPYVTLQSLIENIDDDAPGRAAGAYAVARVTDGRIVVRVYGADPAHYQFEY
jgi:Icc protein